MISQIFTWWHRQTLGTFFKTLFTGKLVGKDQFGNKYYQNKRNERWVIYAAEIDASKITSEWFMWIHHTTDKPPVKNKKPYFWQKNIGRFGPILDCRVLYKKGVPIYLG